MTYYRQGYCSKEISGKYFSEKPKFIPNSEESYTFESPFVHFTYFYGGLHLHYTISSEPPCKASQNNSWVCHLTNKRPWELINASVAWGSASKSAQMTQYDSFKKITSFSLVPKSQTALDICVEWWNEKVLVELQLGVWQQPRFRWAEGWGIIYVCSFVFLVFVFCFFVSVFVLAIFSCVSEPYCMPILVGYIISPYQWNSKEVKLFTFCFYSKLNFFCLFGNLLVISTTGLVIWLPELWQLSSQTATTEHVFTGA